MGKGRQATKRYRGTQADQSQIIRYVRAEFRRFNQMTSFNEMADYLLRLGCRGARNSRNCCPLAKRFTRVAGMTCRIGPSPIWDDPEWYLTVGDLGSIPLPYKLKTLARRFDGGFYDELQWGADVG